MHCSNILQDPNPRTQVEHHRTGDAKAKHRHTSDCSRDVNQMAARTECPVDVSDGANLTAGLVAVTRVIILIITLSGLFHSVLRRFGQPSIISHILAGIIVGETVLGRLVNFRRLGIMNIGDVLNSTIFYGRVLFMFLIGLEMDLKYLRHTLRRSLAIAYSGSAVCLILAGVAGPIFYRMLDTGNSIRSMYTGTMMLMLILSNTASPVLIRIVTELKLTGSDTGRLAIGATLANDITCFLALVMMPASPAEDTGMKLRQRATAWLFMFAVMVVAVAAVVRMAKTLNKMKRGRQYISKYELLAMLVLVVGVCCITEVVGYTAPMTGFLLGLAMPREGPTARTLIDWLTYPVHHLILPVYFGAIGARLDFAFLRGHSGGQMVLAVLFVVLLSIGGKVTGTMVAGWLLNIPARESVVLGFLLNVKGHVDIIAINLGRRRGRAQLVLLLSAILNTFMAGPASAAIVRQQRQAFRYHSHCLQHLKLDDELRVLACVHSPGGVGPMLTLAEFSRSSVHAPLAVYLLHLIELMSTRKYAITHLYHQRTDEENADDEWGYGGHISDIQQVGIAADTFTYDTGVPVRQMTAVSNIVSMDADVCNGIEDVRASLVLLPFHKEQKYDGRMVCRREERRALNERVLQSAPCTVGILVERHLVGIGAATMASVRPSTTSTLVPDEEPALVHHVAVVFLGGPDDREAVAYAGRLAMHPSVSVMVLRFLPQETLDGKSSRSIRSSRCGSDLVLIIGEDDEEGAADEKFMADFYNRLVVPGLVSYMERYVGDGPETVMALSSMAGRFSLFIVGKGGGTSQPSPLTTGIGDWEECPELGPIGDLLASDDFMDCGSVLILQQHSVHK